MTKSQKKIIKNYKHEIRSLLPIFTKNELHFLNDISVSIKDYTTSDENFSKDSLIENIGEPKDIVARYLTDMNADSLRKVLSRTRYIRIATVFIISIAIFTGAFKITTDYMAYKEAQDAYIHREIIETTEYIEVPVSEDE